MPVLIDGEEWIHGSWKIAVYLDHRYPDRPALMASDAERVAAQFMSSWCDLTLHPALRPLVFLAVFNTSADKDREYFRTSREKLLGKSLEQFCGNREQSIAVFSKTLEPAESTLSDTDYFGGALPNYSDYVLFGSLQWARCVTGTPFLASDTAASCWFDRMLDLYDGYGREAPTVSTVATA